MHMCYDPIGGRSMEHSVEAYMRRIPIGTLEWLAELCDKEPEQYGYLKPLAQRILRQITGKEEEKKA